MNLLKRVHGYWQNFHSELNMLDKVLSTLGLTAGVLGALMVALNAGLFVLGYALFLTSSIAWVVYAIRSKQTNLMFMNLIFAFINALGLYNFS